VKNSPSSGHESAPHTPGDRETCCRDKAWSSKCIAAHDRRLTRLKQCVNGLSPPGTINRLLNRIDRIFRNAFGGQLHWAKSQLTFRIETFYSPPCSVRIFLKEAADLTRIKLCHL